MEPLVTEALERLKVENPVAALYLAKLECEKGELEKRVAASAAEMERFRSTASHDMKEPLRMIILHLSLLNREMKGKLTPTAEDSIRFAITSSKRLAALLDSLVAYARCQTAILEMAPTNCQALFDEVLQEFKKPIQDRGFQISAQGLPTLKGDPRFLRQVFQNLVSNAIKFNKSEAPTIRVSAREQDTHCIIELEDNGVGIPDGFVDRVFEPFVRGHCRNDFEGAGMGLSVCKAIVERHGGQISVFSQAGKGSRFQFSLPR